MVYQLRKHPVSLKIIFGLTIFICGWGLYKGVLFFAAPIAVSLCASLLPDEVIMKFSMGRGGGGFRTANEARWTLGVLSLIAAVACLFIPAGAL